MNIDVIGALRFEIRGSQAEWAKANGLSAAYVNDILNGRRSPGPKLLSILGLEKTVTYSPIKPHPKPNKDKTDE